MMNLANMSQKMRR